MNMIKFILILQENRASEVNRTSPQQLMASVNYPDMTIFADSEVNFRNPTLVGRLVVLKGPPPVHVDVVDIQQALLQACQIYIAPGNISRYVWEYLVTANTYEDASTILNAQSIEIHDELFVVIPWTPERGSTRLPLDASLPGLPTPAILAIQPGPVGPSEPLRVVIYGMPPHLFGQHHIVARMFNNRCQIRDLRFHSVDLTISFITHAPSAVIPRVLRVGVRTKEGSRYFLHIWELLIAVQPLTPDELALMSHQEGKSSYYRILLL
jgi:hypothetical protein